jgi:adenine-specific DNA-methyltransferase
MSMSSTRATPAEKKFQNRLDYLLSRVKEADLRAGLERETAKLRMNRKFGLVFEEHMPEHVRLYQLPISIGAKVVRREGKGDDVFNVISIEKGQAHLSHEIDGHWEDAKTDELVVIKKFGEPIYPALVPVDRVTRAEDKPYHTIINGDNFHALQLLLYCYEGKIDVIYIDPPYNTGARDWKYNNNYVDNNDQYRHSKWLSMIKKRLLLAKRLLRTDGVLIVTIDDHETHHLQMLLEDIFPERELTNVVIEHNPKGSPSRNFTYSHEYAHFMIPKNRAVIGLDPKTEEDTRNLRRAGRASRREERQTMFYPIYVKNGIISRIGVCPPASFHPKKRNVHLKDGEVEIWPIDDEGRERRWNFGLDSITEEIKRIEVREKDGDFQLCVLANPRRYKTVWTGGELDAGKYGTTLVKDIVGQEFPFPKSLLATMHCIGTVVRDRKNAIILDFFAGSGTTLHATCLLNAEELAEQKKKIEEAESPKEKQKLQQAMSGLGKRQCILVTNNEVAEKTTKELIEQNIYQSDPRFEEHGICESVTWPRCKYAVQGKRDDGTELVGEYLSGRPLKEGFEENIEYFRLEYLNSDDVAYREKLQDILPMLWFIAGSEGEMGSAKNNGKWFIPKYSPFAVLIDETIFTAFKEEIGKRQDMTHVFIVTDSEEAYREMCQRLPQKLKTKMLYKSYLENFRINTAQNL